MTKEIIDEITETAVDDQETTVTLESDSDVNSENTEPDNIVPEDETSKTFTQDELDNAIKKRLSRERRKWERENKPISTPVESLESISIDQFDSAEDYAEVLAQRKAEQIVNQKNRQKQLNDILDAYSEREDEARDKYDDYDQIVGSPSLKISEEMASAIKLSEIGPDIAYHLGTNPKEADRIHRLHPVAQIKEIGKIESRIAAEPIIKKTSSAPSPINPISARTAGNPKYDTTDPRSIKTMSTEQWIKAEEDRQIKKIKDRLI